MRIDVDAIMQLDRESLLSLWQQKLPKVPLPNLHLKLLRKALIYELQIKARGDLPAAAKRVLRSYLPKAPKMGSRTGSGTSHALQISPGTVLIREWNGRRYQVKALERGFEMDERTYKSLTQIAKTITGTQWSGPRFFGLVKAS